MGANEMKKNVDYIVFALKQMKEAEKFGFTLNHCNRNLKLAINLYWQNKEIGMHVFRKDKHPKSKAASKLAKKLKYKKITLKEFKNKTVVEHAVPNQVIVNKLYELKKFEPRKVEKILKKYWRIMTITTRENDILNSKKTDLRYKMPKNWDGKDVFARYKAVKIKY